MCKIFLPTCELRGPNFTTSGTDMGQPSVHNKFNLDFRQLAEIQNNSDKKATRVVMCTKIVDFLTPVTFRERTSQMSDQIFKVQFRI